MKIFNKELRQLLAEFPDWRRTITGGNHIKLVSADGDIVYSGGTTCNWRGLRNLKARLRRFERGNADAS